MSDLAASNQHWNFANVWEGIARVVPDRPALLHDGRAISWAEFDRRSNALARFLLDRLPKLVLLTLLHVTLCYLMYSIYNYT